jgi:hypothetical protein
VLTGQKEVLAQGMINNGCEAFIMFVIVFFKIPAPNGDCSSAGSNCFRITKTGIFTI